MRNSLLKQIWVAFKIWLFALATNTILGSLYLSGGLDYDLMYMGVFFGAIFSFPIFLLLLLVINRCLSGNMRGIQIFRIVILTGLGLTVIAFLLFMQSGLGVGGDGLGLLMISLLSAITGVCTQYRALVNLSDVSENYDNYLW